MSKLTYLGATHVVPTGDGIQGLHRKGVRYPVQAWDREGRYPAACIPDGYVLVGQVALGLGGCAFLPHGGYWKTVHTFRVS